MGNGILSGRIRGGDRRFARARAAGASALCAALVLLLPGFAQAQPTHRFSEIFGSAVQPAFGEAAGVALDPGTGDLLVIDLEDQTVRRFNPDGSPAPFSALAGNVIDGHPGEEDATPEGEILSTEIDSPSEVQVAISPPGAVGGTAGDIYVTDAFHGKVDIFESTGKFIGQRSFGYPCGVAVDSSGDLLVGSFEGQAGVYKLIPSAPGVFGESPASPFPFTGGPLGGGPCQVAAGTGASEGFVFATAFNGPVAKIDSIGAEEGTVKYTAAGGGHTTVAVGPGDGDIYAAAGSTVEQVDVSGPAPDAVDQFSTPTPAWGIALDASGNAYLSEGSTPTIAVYGPATVVAVSTVPATEVGRSTVTLNGTINDETTEVTECFFEYGETTSYDSVAPCTFVDGTPITGPSEIPKDGSTHAVSAKASLPALNTEFHYRLVAANSVEQVTGSDETFKTLGPPLIDAESVSGITATRATISGSIEPRGESTSFFVEYVTEAQFIAGEYAGATKVPVPAKAIGSSIGPVPVSQEIGGLTPGTSYHFRLVATNGTDPAVLGPDRAFATLPAAVGLPDLRAYEMISPPEKGGEVFPPESEGLLGGSCFQCLPGAERARMPMLVSADGSSVVYEGQPFHAGLGSESNEYVGRRDPSSGWATVGLSQPQYRTNPFHAQATGFLAFSSDFSSGVLSQAQPSLTSDAPAEFANLYLWHQGAALRPLLTQAPPERQASGPEPFVALYAGGNAGEGPAAPFSHVIFEANDALTGPTATAPASPAVGPEGSNIYEWVDGQVRLVNVLPGNTATAPGAVVGSGHIGQEHPGAESPVFNDAISADGERVFFTYPGFYEEPPGSSNFVNAPLLARIGGTETIELDALQPSAPGLFSGGGDYLGATPDGSKVFFTGEGGLTPGAHFFAGPDLYVYDFAKPASERLTDLTTGAEPAAVQGLLGTSADGSYVYFVAEGNLTGAEENANEEVAETGADNLYVWHEGSTAFIGRLLASDNTAFNLEKMGDWKPSQSDRTAQVSPDGKFLAFTSAAELTGYDNTQASGAACRSGTNPVSICSEVFEYDAVAGSLTCVSCNPNQQQPLGHSNLSLLQHTNTTTTFFPQLGNLSADGRLFFESEDALSPNDINGRTGDVYEWEPNGRGTCGRPAGCVSLISTGHSPTDSLFFGASASGDDAFIVTRERLLPRDHDDFLDLYDVRVGGGFLGTGVSPCGGEACRGPATAAPGEQEVGSATGGGPEHKPKKKKRHHHKRKKHHHGHKHQAGKRAAGASRGAAK